MLSIKCGQRSSINYKVTRLFKWAQYMPPIRKPIWMDSKFEADGKTPWRLMQCALHRAQTHGAGWNNFSDFWQKKDSVERQIVKGWYKFVGCKVGDRCLSSHRSSSVVASFIIPKGPCVSRTLVMSGLVLSYNLLSWNVLSYNVLSCFDQENFCHRDLWLCENSRLAQLCFL